MSRPQVPRSVPTIEVCSSCLRRSCWEGIFYCEDFKSAGLVSKTEAELRSLDREHPDHFMPAFKKEERAILSSVPGKRRRA